MGKSKAGRRAAQKAKKRAAKAEGMGAGTRSDGTGGPTSVEAGGKEILQKKDLAEEERELMEQEDKIRRDDEMRSSQKSDGVFDSRYSQEGLVKTIEKSFEN